MKNYVVLTIKEELLNGFISGEGALSSLFIERSFDTISEMYNYIEQHAEYNKIHGYLLIPWFVCDAEIKKFLDEEEES